MSRRRLFVVGSSLFLVVMLIGVSRLVSAQKETGKSQQPVVVKSNHSFDDTVAKLRATIKEKKLAIIYEANHKNMIAMVGLESKSSINIGFASPQMGNKALSAEPKAAVEMPMRAAVREMDSGDIVVIYYQPSYLFSHYNNPKLDKVGQMADKMVGSIVKAATE